MAPAGISLAAVRGFLASNPLSINLLKAMAALRANSIHKITSTSFCKLKVALPLCIAKEKPINAKGNAKIV